MTLSTMVTARMSLLLSLLLLLIVLVAVAIMVIYNSRCYVLLDCWCLTSLLLYTLIKLGKTLL